MEDSCELFDQLLDMIIGATKKVLNRVKGRCDYMLIVGGFGESTYLVEKLRKAFAGNVTHRIVSPDVPSQAVLKGKCCTVSGLLSRLSDILRKCLRPTTPCHKP